MTTFKILLSLEVTDTTSPDLTFITLTSLLNVPTLRFGIFLSICGDVSLFAVTVTGIVTVADGVVLLSTFNFVSPASAVSIASRLNVLSVWSCINFNFAAVPVATSSEYLTSVHPFKIPFGRIGSDVVVPFSTVILFVLINAILSAVETEVPTRLISFKFVIDFNASIFLIFILLLKSNFSHPVASFKYSTSVSVRFLLERLISFLAANSAFVIWPFVPPSASYKE